MKLKYHKYEFIYEWFWDDQSMSSEFPDSLELIWLECRLETTSTHFYDQIRLLICLGSGVVIRPERSRLDRSDGE